MDVEHLKEILHLHALWIKNPEEGFRANLSEADLRRADLRGANLRWADLRGAKFTVELKDAVDLHTTTYDPQQFALLALNLRFLESVQSSTDG